jgi:predicted AAA+ superfamily ATPase
MKRRALDELLKWRNRAGRKPLVLRGARQVGKSHLARALAAEAFEGILELNFERDASLAGLFSGASVKETVRLLEARYGMAVVEGRTLLFLDEIQAAPEVFAKLRYFHEELPGLHVLAAGSLLDLLLEDHAFSMPVGRIEYLHLGPLLFEEFLQATGRAGLISWMAGWSWGEAFPEALHEDLLAAFRQYLVVGGMPEAVAVFAETGSYRDCARVQESILATYQDDFQKYARRVQKPRMDRLFACVPAMLGRKFKFSEVDPAERSKNLGEALHLLCLARVFHKVRRCHGNGVPLAAEANDRNFKVFLLDVGLACRALGLQIDSLEKLDELFLVNRGALCEQAIAQNLLHGGDPWTKPEAFYWTRESPNSTAEVDFLAQLGSGILPVEVKAGKTGRLKSLQLFLTEKSSHAALRFNADKPSVAFIEGEGTTSKLVSLPLPFIGQFPRLVQSAPNQTSSQEKPSR